MLKIQVFWVAALCLLETTSRRFEKFKCLSENTIATTQRPIAKDLNLKYSGCQMDFQPSCKRRKLHTTFCRKIEVMRELCYYSEF